MSIGLALSGLCVCVGWGGGGGGGWLVDCVQRQVLRARMPLFPSFILLVRFSDTLLVVSILDIVYD